MGCLDRHREKSRDRELLLCCFILATLALAGTVIPLSITPAHPYLSASSCAQHLSRTNKTSEPGPEGIGATPVVDQPSRLPELGPENGCFAIHEAPLAMQLPGLLHIYYLRPPPTI